MKGIAILFGIGFLLAGILGFFPAMTPNGNLLGIFGVNAAHNLVHIITGIVALWIGFLSSYAVQVFFKIFGIVYVIVALLGFVYGDQPILGIIANNRPDAWIHLAIGLIALYLGFRKKSKA